MVFIVPYADIRITLAGLFEPGLLEWSGMQREVVGHIHGHLMCLPRPILRHSPSLFSLFCKWIPPKATVMIGIKINKCAGDAVSRCTNFAIRLLFPASELNPLVKILSSFSRRISGSCAYKKVRVLKLCTHNCHCHPQHVVSPRLFWVLLFLHLLGGPAISGRLFLLSVFIKRIILASAIVVFLFVFFLLFLETRCFYSYLFRALIIHCRCEGALFHSFILYFSYFFSLCFFFVIGPCLRSYLLFSKIKSRDLKKNAFSVSF